MNAVEIEEAVTELVGKPFDAAEFPFAFLEAFGNKETTLKRLRKGESNKSDVGGVLQTNNIHIATCPPGEVTRTLARLRASPATTRAKAKIILATDGEAIEAEELASGETVACAYADLPNHFGFFLALAGITTVKQLRDNAFDIRATGRLNKLYVELLKENPDWGEGERRHDMNHFMARLIFCFFAESTDIFRSAGLFTATVEQMSARDASDTHEVIGMIFRAMNTATKHDGRPDDRHRKAAGIRPWADVFPFVNGGLFSGSLDVPRFSRIARSYLLHIGGLDWRQINPDIFGSMIQAVAEDEERGALGMHYTSVPNILKVLKVPNAVSAFVATNSICQGQQAIDIWPVAFERGYEVRFAHTSFNWTNLASNNAGVTVVIVGLADKSSLPKLLYQNGIVKQCSTISPYLVPDSLAYVEKASQPMGQQSMMLFGNMPRDGGHLFLDAELAEMVIAEDANAQPFVKRFVGSTS